MARGYSRLRFFRGLRNTSSSLQNLKQTPTNSRDDIVMRRAQMKQNKHARSVTRAFGRIRGGTDL